MNGSAATLGEIAQEPLRLTGPVVHLTDKNKVELVVLQHLLPGTDGRAVVFAPNANRSGMLAMAGGQDRVVRARDLFDSLDGLMDAMARRMGLEVHGDDLRVPVAAEGGAP